MLTKVKMHQLGFDYLDDSRLYADFLRSITPSGQSKFREAYAYGLGMILQYNKQFIFSQLKDQSIGDLRKPEYLHLVIASEIEEPGTSRVSQNNISILHRELINNMKKGVQGSLWKK